MLPVWLNTVKCQINRIISISFGEEKLKETKEIVQPERDNPLWKQLIDELTILYKEKLKLVFPSQWNKNCFSLFHNMEKYGFRRELQYNFKETQKNLENPDLVFLFITKDDEPQIVILGYSILDNQKKSFYLDTFAVKPRGKGIGNIVIQFLIRWAKTKNYNSINLDTEVQDEKGFPLKEFYSKLGFETISISEKGDVIMKFKL
jgi:GNAT superfamily N-acetyltransferase